MSITLFPTEGWQYATGITHNLYAVNGCYFSSWCYNKKVSHTKKRMFCSRNKRYWKCYEKGKAETHVYTTDQTHNALYLFGIAIMHVRFNFSFWTIRLKALKQFLNMDEGFLLKETEKISCLPPSFDCPERVLIFCIYKYLNIYFELI